MFCGLATGLNIQSLIVSQDQVIDVVHVLLLVLIASALLLIAIQKHRQKLGVNKKSRVWKLKEIQEDEKGIKLGTEVHMELQDCLSNHSLPTSLCQKDPRPHQDH